MEFATRIRHWKSIAHWWWTLIAIGWTLLSAFDTLVAKYGSAKFQAAWNGAWVHPHWGWHVWLIGFFGITTLLVLEGSYQQSEKQNRILADLRPRIAFRTARKSADQWLYTQNLFSLTHIGGQAARFIQVQIIQKGDQELFFGQIDLLDSVSREAVLSFDLTPPVEKTESERIGRFVEFLGERECNFAVKVNFRWNEHPVEERVILNWNPSRMMLSTFPESYPATQLSDPTD